ncbi:hypothetical protein GCM10010207_79300 [Streptomyces atratus]|nr:hypothetical protein GCM10010207_79300 [Streptomyces atratus]
MPHVVVEQAERDLLQGVGDGADLGEDIDAVPVVGDHAGPCSVITERRNSVITGPVSVPAASVPNRAYPRDH